MAENRQRVEKEELSIEQRILIEINDLKQTLAATDPEFAVRSDIKMLSSTVKELSDRVEDIEDHLSSKNPEKKTKNRKPVEREEREPKEEETEEEPKF